MPERKSFNIGGCETAAQEPWTTFSCGMAPGVEVMCEMAQDNVARAVFHVPDRTHVFKPRLFEKIVTAIALASPAQIREFFGDE